MSYEQLKKLKQIETRSTNVEDAMKVADYFGLTLDEFVLGQRASSPSGIVRLLASLSPEARNFLVNAAKAQLAAEGDKPEQPQDTSK